jgi:hypothetical protein
MRTRGAILACCVLVVSTFIVLPAKGQQDEIERLTAGTTDPWSTTVRSTLAPRRRRTCR